MSENAWFTDKNWIRSIVCVSASLVLVVSYRDNSVSDSNIISLERNNFADLVGFGRNGED